MNGRVKLLTGSLNSFLAEPCLHFLKWFSFIFNAVFLYMFAPICDSYFSSLFYGCRSGSVRLDGGRDEGAETAYFLCNKDDPTQQHLYAVSLRGGALRCLTDGRAPVNRGYCKLFGSPCSRIQDPPPTTGI